MKCMTLAEATRRAEKALYKLEELIKEDDGLNPERSKFLKRVHEGLDGRCDGLWAVLDCDY